MRQKKGFTLIELLVVIAIIALLVSILLPSLNRARELAKRAVCASSLNGMGKSLAVYNSENSDSYPMLPATGWKENVGTARGTKPAADARSVTSLMFMMVANGQAAKMFVCPSDAAGAEDTDVKWNDANANNGYYWDFKEKKNVSYSYQVPLYDGTNYSNGVSSTAEGGLAIMADKTPQDSGVSGVAPIDWSASTATGAAAMKGMSQNHTNGEVINVLFAGGYVNAGAKRADVGLDKDNIYSTTDSTTAGDLQKATGVDPTKHNNARDSFLYGGTK